MQRSYRRQSRMYKISTVPLVDSRATYAGRRKGKMDILLRCGKIAPNEHRELCVFDVAGRPAVQKHARHVLFAAIQIASAGNVIALSSHSMHETCHFQSTKLKNFCVQHVGTSPVNVGRRCRRPCRRKGKLNLGSILMYVWTAKTENYAEMMQQ